MAYLKEGGLIRSDILELNVSEHCNMSCRGCSHLSPVAKKRDLSPEAAAVDLAGLSTAYRAKRLRLLGGEPLLHPRLRELVDQIRATGVAEKLVIVTNGIALDDTADELWSAVDEIEVSVYPSRRPDEATWTRWSGRAEAHGTRLTGKVFASFRESHVESPIEDPVLVRRIRRSCLVAGPWGCHNVKDGRFYKCPQAHVLPSSLPRFDRSLPDSGIPIHEAGLLERLAVYLDDPEPLGACRHCLGSVGRLFPHEELSRREWRGPKERSPESLLDWDFLRRLEDEDPEADDGCCSESWEAKAP